MPCLQPSAHLAEPAPHAARGSGQREPAAQAGLRGNTPCPALPEMMPSFLARQAPASDNAHSLLLPLHLGAGAGHSSPAAQQGSALSSPKSSLQFSVRNSTSTFTCTQQTLALKPPASKRTKQPFPLLTLASAQQALAAGLLLQAATPPAFAQGRRPAESSAQPGSERPARLQPSPRCSVPSRSPPAWPPEGAGPPWVGSADWAQHRWPGYCSSSCWWLRCGRCAGGGAAGASGGGGWLRATSRPP